MLNFVYIFFYRKRKIYKWSMCGGGCSSSMWFFCPILHS